MNTPDFHTYKTYCATVGFFDGVHLGHHYLIEELISTAREKGQKSLIITFSTHPRKVLHSDFQPELLTTLEEKLQLIQSAGVDECVVLDFSTEMASMSAEKFMKKVLKDKYNVATLLVGYDHRFGHNREESFENYKMYGEKMGIEVIQTKCRMLNNETHISSSEIRRALYDGDVEKANRLLGYNYSFKGKVADGFKVGRKIGFPTANLVLENDEKLIPATGVYVVGIEYENKTYPGMMNIGSRPTLNNGENLSIEVHIVNFDKNIYGETLDVFFLKKIRDEKKFNKIEDLTAQLKKDKQIVLDYWNNKTGSNDINS